MRFTLPANLLALALGIGLTATAWGDDVSLTKEQVPAAVMATMVKAAAGQTLGAFEKETAKDGTVVYTANFKDKDGKEQEIEVSPNGTLIKVSPE